MNPTSKQDRFMALYRPLQQRLERYALTLTRDRDEAKDIVGETVLKAFEHFEQLREEQAFLSFLFTIATRVMQQRKFRRAERMSEEQIEDLFDNHTQPDLAADIVVLYEALDKLSPEQRQALVLSEIEGFSHKEIRDIQGGSLTAVKVRIFRAKRSLAKLMGSKTYDKEAIEDTGPEVDFVPDS